jgi:hypothetical protein
VLERVWKEFGFVPGPGIPPPEGDETRIQKVRRVLGTVYHTTFAAGLCCATLIACQSLPPEVESMTSDHFELPSGKGAAWKINWSRSTPEVRKNLNFLSLAFSLRRALDDMDLVRVREVLGSAAEAGLIEHPLFTQSVELLERINAADLTASSLEKPSSPT